MHKLLLFLFALLLPITANATTCTGATYLYSSSVPTGYTELEYIESTGTQYIDTGYYPNSETKVETRARIMLDQLEDNEWPMLFGAIYQYNNNGNLMQYSAYNNAYYFYYTYGPKNYGDNDIIAPISVVDQMDRTYIMDKNGVDIDGTMYSNNEPPTTFNIANTMFLFARNEFGTPYNLGKARIYYFKIYDNNILVRNFIPARRNSDNAVGMYDTVTDTFFANSGTGTFVAGADVGTCAACPSNNTNVATYCPGDNQIHNCPTASYYASRVTRYGYWTSNGIHNTVDGCRAYITEQDPTGDYGLSCEIYNGDYGVGGSEGKCMAEWVGWCAAGRYAPYDNPNTNIVWRQSVEAMVGEVCVDVGVGYYSPDGDLGRYECTNTKPANSHYSGSGGATNNCPFECDSGYGLYNGVCHARCPYGDGELHVGQYTHPLWADITNVPSPSVYIGELGPNRDGLCYAYLEPDDTPVDNHHGFHTVHNGVPYHVINLGLYGLE